MHPYRGIFHADRRPDGISKIPDTPNNYTRQYDGMNDAPRNPLREPFAWNPDRTRPGSTLRLRLPSHNLHQSHNSLEHSTAASRAHPFPCKLSQPSPVILIGSFALVSGSDLIRLTISKLI